jgi:dephospho-CoA kinase
MLKLKKIAITGGVASGKSSVCRFFEELGACVVNADELVHDLLVPDTALGQQVIQILGLNVVSEGKISRRIIAEKVFKNRQLLEALEKLLHPAVLKKIEERYAEASRTGEYTFFAVEIPLLFEIGNEGFYDIVVAVLADEAIAKKRFAAAGFQQEEYDRRMHRQMNPHQKALRAHYTIHNNGSLEDLQRQVIALNQTIHKR